jgi:hypothetical protein
MSRTTIQSVSTATFTRPADTNIYAATDSVNVATTGVALEFKSMVPIPGMGGILRGAVMHKTDQDLTAAAFDLYLFDTAPAGAGFEDNAVIAITDAEWLNCVGFIEFAQADGRSVVTGDLWNKTNLDLAYQTVKNDSSLYGVLVAQAAYTPASAEVFNIRLFFEVH